MTERTGDTSDCTDCVYVLKNKDMITLSFLAAFFSTLSIIGSSLTIFMILRRKGLGILRNRLVFALGVIDLLASTSFGLYSIPSTPTDVWNRPVIHSYGNEMTCTAQGFFNHIQLAAPSYNAMLCLYYMAVIRYSMQDAVLAKKYELYMHVWPLVPTLTIAIVAAARKLFKSNGRNCYLVYAIKSSSDLISITGVFGSFSFVIIVITMTMTYRTIRAQERAMVNYQFSAGAIDEQPPNPVLRSTFHQAMLYVLGFIIPFLGTIMMLIIENVKELQDYSYGTLLVIEYFQTILLPTQGIWHFIAYVRPSVVNRMRDNSELSVFAALKSVIMERTLSQPPVIRHMPPPTPRTTTQKVEVPIFHHQENTNLGSDMMAIPEPTNGDSSEMKSEATNTNEEKLPAHFHNDDKEDEKSVILASNKGDNDKAMTLPSQTPPPRRGFREIVTFETLEADFPLASNIDYCRRHSNIILSSRHNLGRSERETDFRRGSV